MPTQLKRAEDIMVPLKRYPHIPDSLTLLEAMLVLKRSLVDCADGRQVAPRVLLVFNEQLQFAGVVRRRDIMRGLQPFYLRGPVASQRSFFDVKVDADLTELSADKIAKGMRKRSGKLVREVMIPASATINHDDSVIKAMRQLVECDASILPVVKAGQVVGVLRTVDVMHEIGAMLSLEELEKKYARKE